MVKIDIGKFANTKAMEHFMLVASAVFIIVVEIFYIVKNTSNGLSIIIVPLVARERNGIIKNQ